MSAPATARVLERALELLEIEGWCRGKMMNGTGSRCALGAICDAATRSNRNRENTIEVLRGVVGGSIVRWNDSQRSKRPVLAAFRRAIALAKGEKQV